MRLRRRLVLLCVPTRVVHLGPAVGGAHLFHCLHTLAHTAPQLLDRGPEALQHLQPSPGYAMWRDEDAAEAPLPSHDGKRLAERIVRNRREGSSRRDVPALEHARHHERDAEDVGSARAHPSSLVLDMDERHPATHLDRAQRGARGTRAIIEGQRRGYRCPVDYRRTGCWRRRPAGRAGAMGEERGGARASGSAQRTQ